MVTSACKGNILTAADILPYSAYKAGWLGRQADMCRQADLNNVLSLTANVFAAATDIININNKIGGTRH